MSLKQIATFERKAVRELKCLSKICLIATSVNRAVTKGISNLYRSKWQEFTMQLYLHLFLLLYLGLSLATHHIKTKKISL